MASSPIGSPIATKTQTIRVILERLILYPNARWIDFGRVNGLHRNGPRNAQPIFLEAVKQGVRRCQAVLDRTACGEGQKHSIQTDETELRCRLLQRLDYVVGSSFVSKDCK